MRISYSSVSFLSIFGLVLLRLAATVSADCISSDPSIEQIFAGDRILPVPGSCCMQDVCGLACPVPVEKPASGYGTAVIVFIVLSALIGASTFLYAADNPINFFVGGRSLGYFMVSVALSAQSIDTSSIIGNVNLAYRFSFWDGAAFPIGLALSLILNGIFLAHHIQMDRVLTLPDVYAKRYGRTIEIMASIATITSFIMLLAGNLLGCGLVMSYLWNISVTQGVWVIAVVLWAYTKSGGLVSIVYTDLFQVFVGLTGLVVMAFWFIANEDVPAPPPSIGFPGYIYPDLFGDGGACDMYNGTKCDYNPDSCCYNTALWCPGYPTEDCLKYDRGAYPFGDHPIYPKQMTNPYALDPFPNAIFWNWATIFILGFGNLAALDFQSRCMASKTPNVARVGCIVAGLVTLFVGIPFSYLGAITRVYYGPDSVHSVFEADSCHVHLGLPTCALWVPDDYAFLKVLTHYAPPFLGAWCFVGIIAACMSTADGAILAMSTVVSNNLVRQLSPWFPSVTTMDSQLAISRLATIPTTVVSALIAAYYKSPNGSGGAGYLLIVAFDIVFATAVVPLIACFYVPNPSPRAALVAMLGGAITRLSLEFILPKDGFLILPYDSPAFLNVGTAASANYPAFIDTNATLVWDPEVEPCEQVRYEDYTGVDSISSFLVGIILFALVQILECRRRKPLFHFPGSTGYTKDTEENWGKSTKKERRHSLSKGLPE